MLLNRLRDETNPNHLPITVSDHKTVKPGLLRQVLRDADLSGCAWLRPAAMGRAAVEQAAWGRNASHHWLFQAGAAHAKRGPQVLTSAQTCAIL